MRIFFLFFLLVPIAELFLLIEVGDNIGALPTIGLVLLTAVVGLVTIRSQGFLTMLRARERLMHGEMPGREILEGFMIAIGGILLMVPGFITDAVGLLFMLPWPRRGLLNWVIRSGGFRVMGRSSAGGFTFTGSGGFRQPGQSGNGDIVEGEFTREPGPRDTLERPDSDRRPP